MDHRRPGHDRRAGELPQDAVACSREAFDETLTRGQADKRIDASQHKTGRGVDS